MHIPKLNDPSQIDCLKCLNGYSSLNTQIAINNFLKTNDLKFRKSETEKIKRTERIRLT